MDIKHFFHKDTFTHTYIIFDQKSKDAIIIDPVLDFNSATGLLSTEFSDLCLNFINEQNLLLLGALETHVHADHLTSSQYFKTKFPNLRVGIGNQITQIQTYFKQAWGLEQLSCAGAQFDILFSDQEIFSFGEIKIKFLHTPGHTPCCYGLLINNHLFTGDALFLPDAGTGRCDFPNGSSEQLYDSIQNKFFSLPEATQLYVGHDYGPGGRKILFKSTIGEQKRNNILIKDHTKKEDFIKWRDKKDLSLEPPLLLRPSIKFNLNAGRYQN